MHPRRRIRRHLRKRIAQAPPPQARPHLRPRRMRRMDQALLVKMRFARLGMGRVPGAVFGIVGGGVPVVGSEEEVGVGPGVGAPEVASDVRLEEGEVSACAEGK